MARSLALLVPAGIVLALAACTSGGGAPQPEPTQAGAGASTTDCVADTWELDTTDAANAMLQYLIGVGAPVTDARADGPVVLELHSDGTAEYRTGVTYDFTADAGGVGLEVMQAQAGIAQGEWGWAGSSDTVMTFSGWTSNVTITNTAEAGGTAVNVPFELPDNAPGSTPLTVTCSGDTLTTKANAQPFSLSWGRG